MKPYILALILVFALSVVSCSHTAPPKIEADNNDICMDVTDDNAVESEIPELEAERNEEIIKLLSRVSDDYVCESVPTDRRYMAWTYNNSLYLSFIRSPVELNFETGKTQLICRDPLCSHENQECVSSGYYYSFYIDDGVLYTISGYSVDGAGFRFIGELNPEAGTIKILKDWPGAMTGNSLSLECHDGFIYYARPTSETTNELYRYSIKTQKEEKLSSLDEYIVVFAVYDNIVYFRNSYGIMKFAPLDFSEVTEIDTGVSIIFPRDGYLYYFVNSYDSSNKLDGYDLMRKPLSDINLPAVTVIEKVNNPSQTLYDKGSFYYTPFNYNNNKKLYSYNTATGITTEFNLNYGTECVAMAVVEDIIILQFYTEFDENNEREIEYYLYDTTTNEMFFLVKDCLSY